MNVFAERLKYAMQNAEITQTVLAKKSGISNAAISQYIHGLHVPSQERLQTLANILGTTVDFLLGDCGETSASSVSATVKHITLRMAAKCLRKSEKTVKAGIQSGELPIGRAIHSSESRTTYVITPEKLREEAGEARFNEFFGITN